MESVGEDRTLREVRQVAALRAYHDAEVPAFPGHHVESVFINDGLEVILGDLALLESELGETPLGACISHHRRQGREVAFGVLTALVFVEQVGDFEEVDSRPVRRARQVPGLGVEG